MGGALVQGVSRLRVERAKRVTVTFHFTEVSATSRFLANSNPSGRCNGTFPHLQFVNVSMKLHMCALQTLKKRLRDKPFQNEILDLICSKTAEFNQFGFPGPGFHGKFKFRSGSVPALDLANQVLLTRIGV